MSEALFDQDAYGVVEVMGHNTFAGKISEHVLGGTAFIRVDVAEIPEETRRETGWRGEVRELTIPAVPGFTKLIGAASIYAITPCSEAVAKKVSRQRRALPVALADFSPEIQSKLIEAPKTATAPVDDADGDDAVDDDVTEYPF